MDLASLVITIQYVLKAGLEADGNRDCASVVRNETCSNDLFGSQ